MALHFAFVDGALGYDCVRCGARCCHGLGFALPAAGLTELLSVAPGLGALVQLRPRGAFAVTAADGCFALTADKRCSIELQTSYDNKPLVCRLFPLRARRVGDTLVVDLQLRSCPLQSAEQLTLGPGVARVTHVQAATELTLLQDDPLFDVVTPPRGAPDDLWQREAAAREQVAAALTGPGAELAALGVGDAESALRTRWQRELAIEAVDSRWARTFLLCWPILRLEVLLAPGAPPYPRLLRRLPALAAAGLTLIEMAAALPWPQGRGLQPTPRTVAELWQLQVRHRDLLLSWEERVRLRDGSAPGAPPAVARAYAALVHRVAELPFGAAFAEAAAQPCLPASERALLLRLAADGLTT